MTYNYIMERTVPRASIFLAICLSILIIMITDTEAVESRNRCDTTKSNIIRTPCVNCWQNRKVSCPDDAKKQTRGSGSRGCRYDVRVGSRTKMARGCTHTCRQSATLRQCCSGYWGADCQVCPRDARNVTCGGRGVCSEGLYGNGTCECQGNLAGSLCEKCSQSQFYGPKCQSTCSCIHGTCDNGTKGSGSCSCMSGYDGRYCERELPQCKQLSCSSNANCLNVTGRVACQCKKGYEGDGTTCREIDPCQRGTNSPCHSQGHCVHIGPDKATCACNDGYSGDGYWCLAIDPCQKNRGGCPRESTLCRYDGPNQFHCECRYGYENMTAGSGCSLVDVCGKYEKTTCDPLAECKTVVRDSEITVNCTCPIGYVEVSRVCYSDLLTELDKANQTGRFKNKLNFANEFFKMYYKKLYTPSKWTLFAPTDDAVPPELKSNLSDDLLWRTRVRAHTVVGAMYINFTEESAKTMYPLLGADYPIKALRPGAVEESVDTNNQDYFATIQFGNRLSGKILAEGKYATNGVIYIVDTLLEPPNMQSFVSNVSVIETFQRTPGLDGFIELAMKSYVFRRSLMGNGSFSLFAPSTDALASLTTEEYKYLNSPMGTVSLDLLLQFHLFTDPNTMVTLAIVNRIISSGVIPVNVSKVDGHVSVGKEQARIMMSEIAVDGGRVTIYMIDKLLIPDVIKPLVSNRCNSTSIKQVRGPCGDCDANLCPPGGIVATDSGRDVRTCFYQAEVDSGDGKRRISSRMGCKKMCSVRVTTTSCCPGFYGTECRSCPGPTHHACNNNGICSSGETGTGTCDCNEVFTGLDCSKCVNEGKYGPNCDQDCLCQKGTCKNTIDSHGECVPDSCVEGWAGENCDREELSCLNGSKTCHQYASCIRSSDGTETCVCDPGYTGSGEYCYEHNPCEDANWGGCDVNAYCLHLGSGRTVCECPALYSGDGYTCNPIDPCASEEKGGCSKNGYCVFLGPGKHGCECNMGYMGNGVVCEEVNICLENNGNCSVRARCTPTGPGTRTCECFDGYEGDGTYCLGNALQEITSRSDLSQLQSWTSQWFPLKRQFMNLNRGFTLFLPVDAAWGLLATKDITFWMNEQHITYLLKRHTVPRKLSTTDLQRLKGKRIETSLPTVNIDVNKVTVDASDTNVGDNTIEESTLPTLGASRAKLLVSNIPVSNEGIIHIIDSVLLPPRDVVKDFPALSSYTQNLTGTQFEPYSKFLKLLTTTGVIDQIEEIHNTRPYTLFAIADSANNFPADDISHEDLTRLLRYHVVPQRMIRASNIKSGQHETTMAGDGYQLSLVQFHGRILVNGYQVSTPNMRTATGIVHGLSDKFLTPVKSRCDLYTMTSILSPCLPCSYPNRCPINSQLIEKDHCLYNHVTGRQSTTTVGCNLKCAKQVPVPKCCPNFYGSECLPCSGGVGNACFGVGTCFDGIKGNGTCACNDPKYTGAACELCAEGRYGSSCDHLCKCVNGTCDSGRNGTGTCSCFKGYRGALCDQLADPNDKCGGSCHTAANCVPDVLGSGHHCVCIAGFGGDGKNCSAINLCSSRALSGCSAHATCTYVGPGVRNCTCKEDYTGDGQYCEGINRCIGPNPHKCVPNAHCVQTGANRSNCVCDENYEGDGKSCEPLNLCKQDNGGCTFEQICTSTGPGTRTCACKEDYEWNGSNCIGKISSYVSGTPGYEWFSLMDTGTSQVPNMLSDTGPMILFLPDQASLLSLSQGILSSVEHATNLYLNHIVHCYPEPFNITEHTPIQTLGGTKLSVTKSGDKLLLNDDIVIKSANPVQAANGLIFYIDNPILPEYFVHLSNQSEAPSTMTRSSSFNFSLASSDPPMWNSRMLEDRGYKWFNLLLSKADDIPLLQMRIHNPWTLLIPTDEAFHSLPPQMLRSIMNNKQHAKEYIRSHMIRDSFVAPKSDLRQNALVTMQGMEVNITCSAEMNGEYEVKQNRGKIRAFKVIPLVVTGTWRHYAAVHVVKKIIQPPSIGGRCDNVDSKIISTDCKICVERRERKCPEGTRMIARSECRVPVFAYSLVSVPGCQLTCASYDMTLKCCDGYYGRNCHPCPGGSTSPCNGNGKCSDQIQGDGKCMCKEGFRGVSCEQCKSSRFGRSCLPCRCTLHGSCFDGIDGDGTCFCDNNWTGDTCDRKRSNKTVCNPPCHENGYCVEEGICLCKPGYRGDGINSCDYMAMCSVDNGGCSAYAHCSIVENEVICKCRPNFVGDGYFCEGYDPCMISQDGCHLNGRCVYVSANKSRCECNDGYVGDGITSCAKATGVSRNCATDNGGCSDHAVCTDIPPPFGGYPTTKCVCKTGYTGDGFACHGTVLDVVSETLEMREFFKQLRKQPVRLRRKLNDKSYTFTLFVPLTIAGKWKPMPQYAVTRHIVEKKAYYYNDLQKMQGLLMKSGDMLRVTNDSNRVYINGVPIRKYDIHATNGVIHIVDTFIPKKIVYASNSTKAATQPVKTTKSTRRGGATKPPPTVPHGGRIDAGGVSRPTNKTRISGATRSGPSGPNPSKKSPVVEPGTKTASDGSAPYQRGNGIKIGVSVLIIAMILAGIGTVYWWKNRHNYVFRPLLRQRNGSISDHAEEDTFGGMNNPAYDSTGFNAAEDIVLSDADVDMASAMKEPQGGAFSFENPSCS